MTPLFLVGPRLPVQAKDVASRHLHVVHSATLLLVIRRRRANPDLIDALIAFSVATRRLKHGRFMGFLGYQPNTRWRSGFCLFMGSACDELQEFALAERNVRTS